MPERVRIIIKKNDDPSKDLEVAADLRFDLWAHSPVEIDPEDSETWTRRTPDTGIAWFEFETDYPDEVERIVRKYNYVDLVEVQRPKAGCQAADA